jgi:hypothetical protein
MKHFLTVTKWSRDKGPIVDEHETEDAARKMAETALTTDPLAEVKIYKFLVRARAETVTRFDGGCEK